MSFRVLIGLALLWSVAAHAAFYESREFKSAEHERIYRSLIEELRCLVCQNQNIADSDAELAADLRREVFEMLAAGSSEREILDFMTQRYGDFVLYRPPFKLSTAALWVGPFALVALAFWVLARQVRARARAQAPVAGLSEADRQRIEELTRE